MILNNAENNPVSIYAVISFLLPIIFSKIIRYTVGIHIHHQMHYPNMDKIAGYSPPPIAGKCERAKFAPHFIKEMPVGSIRLTPHIDMAINNSTFI